MTRRFYWYQTFLPLDLYLDFWPTFDKNLTLALTFQQREMGLSYYTSSSLAQVPIRFSPFPLGGLRQVFKLSANLRLTSFASKILVVGSLVMYQFVCICQRGTGWEYDEVLTTYKPYSTLIFDANDVSRKLAGCLKTCLNPPRGRGEEKSGSEPWLAKMITHTSMYSLRYGLSV